jgi:glycosyltransferase involved in cell wall biosynthesis
MKNGLAQPIFVVNRFFHPDISATSQMASQLAFSLAEKGHEVSVITSRLRYEGGEMLSAYEVIRGVSIHRVWTSSWGRSSLVGRSLDYLTFYFSASVLAFSLANRRTTFVVKTDPPLLSLPLGFAVRLRGARLINWLQDVFPEVAKALGVRLPLPGLMPILQALRNRSLRAASTNVAIGSLMAERLQAESRASNFVVIANTLPNADVHPLARENNPLATEWGIGQQLIVGYSGNLGRAHDLDMLINAATRLNGREDIRFLIIGDGKQRKEVEDRCTALGLSNVWFKGYQPQSLLPYSLCVPDVHIVSLRPELEGLIVPSKFYGCIAAGRPVIFLGDDNGELAQVIRETQCGGIVTGGAPDALSQLIEQYAMSPELRQRHGRAARVAFERHYAAHEFVRRWEAVLARE